MKINVVVTESILTVHRFKIEKILCKKVYDANNINSEVSQDRNIFLLSSRFCDLEL